jgi:hypothetical protein
VCVCVCDDDIPGLVASPHPTSFQGTIAKDATYGTLYRYGTIRYIYLIDNHNGKDIVATQIHYI